MGKFKHGGRHTRLYNTWCKMKSRCYHEPDKSYKDYGARGIKVCDEWLLNFATFQKWAFNNDYQDNLTIERINNNGNYEPANCKWITISEQQRNRRDAHLVTIGSETHSIKIWSLITGISYSALKHRVQRKWPEERMLMPEMINQYKFKVEG